MNETENRITPITRNDIAFNRRHLYESDKVKIGKKTFLVTSVFPIGTENGDNPSADEKIKKQDTQGDEFIIKMVKNPDIVAGVAALKNHRPYVVGFAAETNNVEEYARQKRTRKNLDLICANDVSLSTQGFNSDSNALHLFWQDGDKVLPLERKELLGQHLLDEIVTRYDEKNRR